MSTQFLSNADAPRTLDWPDLLSHDPVHPPCAERPLDRRLGQDRRVFAALLDDQPQVLLQIALQKHLVTQTASLWSPKIEETPYAVAVFYSIFRLPWVAFAQGLSERLIIEAAQQLKDGFATINRFVTLSPIPSLSKHLANAVDGTEVLDFLKKGIDPVSRFHMNNGATPIGAWRHADPTALRQKESYGWMTSYEYPV